MSDKGLMAVLMDPISQVDYKKDTTLLLLAAARDMGWELLYMEPSDLVGTGGAQELFLRGRPLEVRIDSQDWFELGEPQKVPAGQVQTLQMRKDPPFNMEFVYATYLLEALSAAGVRVVNRPSSLRDLNEKAALLHFADQAPDFLISCNMADLAAFAEQYGGAVVKPLDGMGGQSIYRLVPGDTNLPVILEDITAQGTRTVMVQQHLSEIADGDRRVFLIDGEPAQHMLVRHPAKGEMRGNMAAGASTEVLPLGQAEERIARVVGPELKRRGVLFAGLDIIGNYLTEVNITSPTGLRQLQRAGHDLSGEIIAALDSWQG